MSSAQPPFNSRMVELTQCSICMETLKKPKCLPCIHTFCLECLEKFGKDEQPGDKMACPLCRKTFEIPSKGFEDLPNNFFVQDLLLISEWKSATSKCDICVDPTPARDYCVICDQHLCQMCTSNHRKIKITASHNTVSLEEKEHSQVMMKARPRFCETHNDKVLELYCYDCKLVICLMCSVLSHKQHHCADLREASTKFMGQLNSHILPITSCVQENKKELEELNLTKISFLTEISETEGAIIRKCDELKKLIDTQKRRLLKRLEEKKTKASKEMQTRQNDVERQMMIMTSHKQYLEELGDKGSACDIARSANELLKRTEELVMSQDQFSKNALTSVEMIFNATSLPYGFSKGTGLVGAIEDQTKERSLIALGLDIGSTMFQQVWHVSIDRLDSVRTIDSTPTWIDKEAAACVIGDNLFAVGIGRMYNELWKWNVSSGWKRFANMSSGRRRHCAAVVDSTVYALGGLSLHSKAIVMSSVVTNTTERNVWYEAYPLRHGVRNAACVIYKKAIYVFGGCGEDDNAVDHVQKYDDATEMCTLMNNAMPRACCFMRAVLWNTIAILIGQQTCCLYDFETQTWQERKDVMTKVIHFGALIKNGTIYIAGGGTAVQDNKTTIWTCTDEVRRVSVRDVIEGKPAIWKHHAKLPRPAMMQAFGTVPMKW